MAYCPTCGNETPPDARFCASCGQEFAPPAAQPEYAAAQGGPRFTTSPPQQQPAWQQQGPGTWPGQNVGLPAYGPNSLADPGQRLVARLIDWVVVGGAFIVLVMIFLAPASMVTVTETPGTTLRSVEPGSGMFFFGGFLVPLIALLLYEVVMIAVWGQTLGKMAMGIRVVRSAAGEIPGWGPSFVRWIIQGIMGIVPLLPLLDYLWLLWDENRQCLHDKAASTLVVRLR